MNEIMKGNDFISLKVVSGNIEVYIKYPKQSKLKTQLEMIDKLIQLLSRV